MSGSFFLADARDAEAALSGQARTVVIDLRTADGPAAQEARELAGRALEAAAGRPGTPSVVIALHPLGSPHAAADLSALCPLKPCGVLLPRCEAGADVQHLGALLAVEEARAGLDDGAIHILALAETGAALFGLISLVRSSRRLAGLAWDGEALGRDIAADVAREADGRWSDPCQTARTLTLAACADNRLPAIDATFGGEDLALFAQEAERARRDGFTGKLCRSADQVAIVNAVFARS